MKTTTRMLTTIASLLASSLLLAACQPQGMEEDALSDDDFELAAASEGKADGNGMGSKKKVQRRFLRLISEGDLQPQVDAVSKLALESGDRVQAQLAPPDGFHRFEINAAQGQEVRFRFETPSEGFLPILLIRAKATGQAVTQSTEGSVAQPSSSSYVWIRIKSKKKDDVWEGQKDARVMTLDWQSPDGGTYELLLTSRKNLQKAEAKTNAKYAIQACTKSAVGDGFDCAKM